jgi:hypothetical protein
MPVNKKSRMGTHPSKVQGKKKENTKENWDASCK